MRVETNACMLRLLSARNIILRTLAAAAEPTPDLFTQLAVELEQLDQQVIPLILEKFQTDSKKDTPCNILIPLDAFERLREVHHSEQLKTIACLLTSLSRIRCPDFDCIEKLRTSPCLQPLPIPERNTPVSFKNFLFRASTCSESLAIISIICSVYAMQLEPHRTSQKKNKKKCNKKIEANGINGSNETKVSISHNYFLY